MNAFTKWLDRLLSEKNVDVENTIFTIKGPSGTNVIPLGVVVEKIKGTSPREQASIKTMLVKIDFVNGDVVRYFEHLAKAIAL